MSYALQASRVRMACCSGAYCLQAGPLLKAVQSSPARMPTESARVQTSESGKHHAGRQRLANHFPADATVGDDVTDEGGKEEIGRHDANLSDRRAIQEPSVSPPGLVLRDRGSLTNGSVCTSLAQAGSEGSYLVHDMRVVAGNGDSAVFEVVYKCTSHSRDVAETARVSQLVRPKRDTPTASLPDHDPKQFAEVYSSLCKRGFSPEAIFRDMDMTKDEASTMARQFAESKMPDNHLIEKMPCTGDLKKASLKLSVSAFFKSKVKEAELTDHLDKQPEDLSGVAESSSATAEVVLPQQPATSDQADSTSAETRPGGEEDDQPESESERNDRISTILQDGEEAGAATTSAPDDVIDDTTDVHGAPSPPAEVPDGVNAASPSERTVDCSSASCRKMPCGHELVLTVYLKESEWSLSSSSEGHSHTQGTSDVYDGIVYHRGRPKNRLEHQLLWHCPPCLRLVVIRSRRHAAKDAGGPG